MFADLMTLTDQGNDVLLAPPAPDKGERLFGGQFLAQSVRAAQATTDTDRVVNALHGYFMRPGDVDAPIDMHVERIRDGRTFSTREVRACQNGKVMFQATISFQVPDETPEYAGSTLPDVPPPDAVPGTYDDFTLAVSGEPDWHGRDRPIDIRYVNPPTAERGVPITEDQLMWTRIRTPLPDDPALHLSGLAYLSDATLVDHIMLPLGKRWQDKDFAGTSLDHCMWFHRPARSDEWLLFRQSVDATGRGRGLARGRFYAADGTLVATCMQEGLMRWLT